MSFVVSHVDARDRLRGRAPLIIAIDGPSGAGKGTVARAIADELGYRHVDSGAMYRAVGWKALEAGIPLDDEAAVAALAERSRITSRPGRDDRRGRRHARDPYAGNRSRRGGGGASSARPRRAGRTPAADGSGRRDRDGGRDIGTVVFPKADVKIYLDASPEERARRRATDPAHSGPAAVADVATALTARDEIDRTRAASPLYAAPDAVVVDTTGKSIARWSRGAGDRRRG